MREISGECDRDVRGSEGGDYLEAGLLQATDPEQAKPGEALQLRGSQIIDLGVASDVES